MMIKKVVLLAVLAQCTQAMAGADTFLDRFDTVSYSNSDGTANFSSDWTEANDDDSPSTGKIRIENNRLLFEDMDTATIERGINLSGYAAVTLTLDYQRTGGDEKVKVELFDTTTNAWTKVKQLNSDTPKRLTYELNSNQIDSGTKIQFVTGSGNWNGTTETVVVDNVKFRAFADTDGDGVADDKDVDDDNDGILNSIEFQGSDPHCPRGFFQSSQGTTDDTKTQLRIIGDVTFDLQMNIGSEKPAYNALAFNENDGYLYALATDTGSDDEGTSVAIGDILRIDPKTGATKRLINSGVNKSVAGAAYEGKYYFLNSDDSSTGYNQELLVYDIENNTMDTPVSLDKKFPAGDFVIINGVAYGDRGDDITGDSESRTLYKANLTDGHVTTQTYSMPGATKLTNGSAFVANGTELYFANNGKWGGIYRIDGYATSSPTAVRVSDLYNGNSNDGASCSTAPLPTPIDSDGDHVADYHDLDSDNDGIPDNVEAQSTSGYSAPSGTVNSEGLWDNYGSGLTPPDTDDNGIADFLDNDSDHDGITDCEEGLDGNTYSKSCPVDPATDTIDANGVVNWADNGTGGAGSYEDPNLGINTPKDDLLEYGNAPTNEVDYRKILCGKVERSLAAYTWVTVSVPCNTGSATISQLFGDSLGEYNTHWFMYSQNGAYTGNNANDMVPMNENSTMEPGKGYWIIVDADKNLTVDTTTATGLSATDVYDKSNYTGVGTTDDTFTDVMPYQLTDSQSGRKTKIMLGNPFIRTFGAAQIYYNNSTLTQYYPLNANDTGTYIEQTLYAHENNGMTSDTYYAISSTPGFGDNVDPMVGFWLLIKDDATSGTSSASNIITYPFMKQ